MLDRRGSRYLGFVPFRLVLLALVLTLARNRASRAQDPDDRTSLLARMREAALTYADQLQDFVCLQVATRSVDRSGSGKHWKRLEVQELEVNYVAHKENYVLLKVNGKSRDLEKRIKPGFWRGGGEFGTALRQIFDPQAKGDFSWDHQESDGGQRLCVFRYRVPQETSTMQIRADADLLTLAHHGLVYANCESGAITRIQREAEPARVIRNGHQLLLSNRLDVRYQPTMIGTKEFLLPESAEEINRFGDTWTRMEIQFRNYRKFQVDTKIILDGADKNATKPKPQN